MRTGLKHYILDGHTPVLCTDRMAFMYWMDQADKDGTRRVAVDEIDGYEISTVFLGLDHGWGVTDRPVLFETMVFHPSGLSIGVLNRSSTWDEAAEGHREICVEMRTKRAAPRQ